MMSRAAGSGDSHSISGEAPNSVSELTGAREPKEITTRPRPRCQPLYEARVLGGTSLIAPPYTYLKKWLHLAFSWSGAHQRLSAPRRVLTACVRWT